MDKRIEKMKCVLEHKEATIDELRSRLERAKASGFPDGGGSGHAGTQGTAMDSSRENFVLMTEALRDREEQIEELQEKVKQASTCV